MIKDVKKVILVITSPQITVILGSKLNNTAIGFQNYITRNIREK